MIQKKEMDILYFNKYARYAKHDRFEIFLTLKKCRTSCLTSVPLRYQKSFLRILEYYKMYYEIAIQDKVVHILISKNPIPTKLSEIYRNKMEFNLPITIEYYLLLGKFLEYPYPLDVRKVSKMKEKGEISFVSFYFVPKNKKKEHFHGFGIPISHIDEKFILQIKNQVLKYKRCIQKYLHELYPDFTIEFQISTEL